MVARLPVGTIRRLGILGGTFDPIHVGHLVAAQEAYAQLNLDQVLFVPAGSPPHKPSQPISPVHHRLRMVELAIVGKAHFAVSTIDVERPGPCYSVDTLELLRTEWGLAPSYFFIVGADSLADIVSWHRPLRLIELCELAVVDRPDCPVDLPALERQLPGLTSRIHWVQMPLLGISSSQLRMRIREGRSISFLVPEAVEAYLLDQGLYRDS